MSVPSTTQFVDLPDDTLRLIFEMAISESPVAAVALRAVNRQAKEIMDQCDTWQPLVANHLTTRSLRSLENTERKSEHHLFLFFSFFPATE